MSVRAGTAVVVKGTVLRRLLDGLEAEAPGKVIGPKGGVRMEVGREYRLTDQEEKVAFMGVLALLASMANALCNQEPRHIKGEPWLAFDYL